MVPHQQRGFGSENVDRSAACISKHLQPSSVRAQLFDRLDRGGENPQLPDRPTHCKHRTRNPFLLSPDSIPQLSLGTSALIIFVVCAGFVALRGVTRMVIGTLVLGVSAWIGFRLWQEAPALSIQWTGHSQSWIINGLPVTAFVVSFFLFRKLAKTIAQPFGKLQSSGDGGEQKSSIIRITLRLLLALIPTALIWLVGAMLVHHSGSIAEVRAYSEKPPGTHETIPSGFTERLKTAVDAVLPASWIKALDPLTDPARLTLAKLITAQSDSPHTPVIDPRTGKPIPRAIIVTDPELQNLAREGNFGTLLRHPLLTKALADPNVKKLLKDLSL